MDRKHYELRILPLFEEDLNEIVDYICDVLQNPIAADDMVDAVEEAIYERLSCAEAFEPYHSAKERRYPYYRIPVKKLHHLLCGDRQYHGSAADYVQPPGCDKRNLIAAPLRSFKRYTLSRKQGRKGRSKHPSLLP